MVWKSIFRLRLALIPLTTLMQDNVYDLVMLADVLGGIWHDFVDNFAEESHVSTRVFYD